MTQEERERLEKEIRDRDEEVEKMYDDAKKAFKNFESYMNNSSKMETSKKSSPIHIMGSDKPTKERSKKQKVTIKIIPPKHRCKEQCRENLPRSSRRDKKAKWDAAVEAAFRK